MLANCDDFRNGLSSRCAIFLKVDLHSHYVVLSLLINCPELVNIINKAEH